MEKVKEPVSFIIGPDDIGVLLAGGPELVPNSGSVFYKAAPAAGADADVKTAYSELLADQDFLRALRVIAQPDLYATVRGAGAQGLTELRLHRKKSEGAYVAATEQDADGRWLISLFDDYRNWLVWWTNSFAGPGDVPAANFIPPKVSLEEFLFVLHAVDSFRRVSYENMLSHVFTDRTYVKTPEFLRSMADSLKSLDIRWLLPTFLAVTPGVEQYQTEMSPQNIAILLQHDFFREGKLASGEDVLIFGEAGQIMGVEFFRSWFTSCGMEINVAGADGFKTVERLFIAPTVLANHFVRLEDASGGKALVNHQTYTKEQLAVKLDELFGQAFALDVVPVVAKPAAALVSQPPSPPPEEKSAAAPAQKKAAAPGQAPQAPAGQPAQKFCRQCGTKLTPTASFCKNCGTKV